MEHSIITRTILEYPKCMNFIFCGNYIPDVNTKGNEYICTKCHKNFIVKNSHWNDGKILFIDNDICELCHKDSSYPLDKSINKHGYHILFPKCDHKVCIGCFKYIYGGNIKIDIKPSFPYPKLLSEYNKTMGGGKWDTDPLVKEWEIDFDYWSKYGDAPFLDEVCASNKGLCPVCVHNKLRETHLNEHLNPLK